MPPSEGPRGGSAPPASRRARRRCARPVPPPSLVGLCLGRIWGSPKWLPEGPSTQYSRILVPKAIKGMVLGPESLNIGYLAHLGMVKYWGPFKRSSRSGLPNVPAPRPLAKCLRPGSAVIKTFGMPRAAMCKPVTLKLNLWASYPW